MDCETHLDVLRADVHSSSETPVVRQITQFADVVVVMSVSGSLRTAELDFTALARKFHDHYPDEFDYLIFVSNLPRLEDNQFYRYVGAYRSVQNAVEGIGLGLFGSSEGTLKGTIHMPYRTAILNGPMLHEIWHTWANYTVPTSVRAHWGYSSANGQLGGFDPENLLVLGNGLYSGGDFGPHANGGNSVPYSPIELYLAGLIPPQEVPALWVAKDGKFERRESGNVIFSASEIETWSVQRIVAEHGVRVPDWTTSQKRFRAAAVLLTDDEFTATPTILQQVADHVRTFSHPGPDRFRLFNFWEATGGRATLKMDDLRSGTVGGNRAPVPVGSLASVRLAAGGAAAEVDVAAAFRDPDDDALTYRATSSAPSVAAVSVFGTTVSVTPVAGGTSTVTVTATDPGGLSASQVFTVRVTSSNRYFFTDHPIVPGETPLRAVHFNELRTHIDALRSAAGLGRFPWTDSVLRAGVTRVRLVHLLELRAALSAAYSVAGRPAPTWTDATPVAGTTPVRAAHLMELRGAVLAAVPPPPPPGSTCTEELGAVTGLVTRAGFWNGSCPSPIQTGLLSRIYVFTLNQDASARIELRSPTATPILTLFRGTTPNYSDQIIGTGGLAGGPATIARDLAAGTYTISASTWGEMGDFTLTLSVSTPPPPSGRCGTNLGTLSSAVTLTLSGSWIARCGTYWRRNWVGHQYQFTLAESATLEVQVEAPVTTALYLNDLAGPFSGRGDRGLTAELEDGDYTLDVITDSSTLPMPFTLRLEVGDEGSKTSR